MDWILLNDRNQLSLIDEASKNKKILIFKHSTRCSISDAALGRLERNWKNEHGANLDAYFLDLLKYRDISNAIAEHYDVLHQSPQALIIQNGKCIFSQTHSAIRIDELIEA